MHREEKAQGYRYLEREVFFSHSEKERHEGSLDEAKKQVIHEVNSNRGSSDLGHGKEGLSKRESRTAGLV